MPDLTDAQLLQAFHDKQADLSLLTADEQRRLVALTEPAKEEPSLLARVSNAIGPFKSNEKVSDLPPQSAELRSIAAQRGSATAQQVRDVQSQGENVGIGLGAGMMGGLGIGTGYAANPTLTKAALKAAGTSLAYRAGDALGVPHWILDAAVVAPGGTATLADLMKMRNAAPPAEPPTPPTPRSPRAPMGEARPPEFFTGQEPAPRITGVTQPPRLSAVTRGAAEWQGAPEPAATPQQTSSIQPTPNAYVNVDKAQPLPTDTARTYHTGVSDPAAKQSMSEIHKIISQEDTNYKAMKPTISPADFRQAMLDAIALAKAQAAKGGSE